MGRLVNAGGVAVAIAAAAALYQVKHQAVEAAEGVARLRAEIQRERDSIAVLKAEWSHLDQPARLKALAERHLEIRPVDMQQILRVEDVPLRQAEDAAGEPEAATAPPASPLPASAASAR